MTDIDYRRIFPMGGIQGVFDLSANGRSLTLTHAFAFRDGDVVVTVPSGFMTDFNSVPRPLWVWFPPWECPEAALVHDYGYHFNPGEQSRAYWDAIHRRIMELKGERGSKRWAVWMGIRSGGWKPWNAYRDAEIEEGIGA